MNKYNNTIYACFIGYIVQAIINNFAPILFLTFQKTYGISLKSISLLITINFFTQLLVDIPSSKIIEKIGARATVLVAHTASALGLICLSFLPDILPNSYVGLVISVIFYAIGSGIIEVILSPLVEACPTENKEGTMSLLHSFYCWGHVGVVVLSTLFFTCFGIVNWRILSLLWAIIPIVNGLFFTRLPLPSLEPDGKKGLSLAELFKNKIFWIFFLMMLCSGASEMSVGQWASAFAEKALGISKSVGDLAGPLSFAVLMGISRIFFAKFSEKIRLDRYITGSAVLCILSYLLASLSKNPVFSFIGCALCGLSIGIMWPGTLSLCAANIKRGSTTMFALLALAGDVGCSSGPALIGFISDAAGGNLKIGLLVATIFPIFLLLSLILNKFVKKD